MWNKDRLASATDGLLHQRLRFIVSLGRHKEQAWFNVRASPTCDDDSLIPVLRLATTDDDDAEPQTAFQRENERLHNRTYHWAPRRPIAREARESRQYEEQLQRQAQQPSNALNARDIHDDRDTYAPSTRSAPGASIASASTSSVSTSASAQSSSPSLPAVTPNTDADEHGLFATRAESLEHALAERTRLSSWERHHQVFLDYAQAAQHLRMELAQFAKECRFIAQTVDQVFGEPIQLPAAN